MWGMSQFPFAKKATKPTQQTLPQVNFSEDGEVRYLHLGSEWVQAQEVPAKIEVAQFWLDFQQVWVHPFERAKSA